MLLAVIEAYRAPVDEPKLGLREPIGSAVTLSDAASMIGGQPDLVLMSTRSEVNISAGTHMLRVGPVTPPPYAPEVRQVSDLSLDDPLALRLALLRFQNADPAELSRARLHRAEETLQRWRMKVADWADMPSAPAAPNHVAAMRDALIPGLDTSSVLKQLHRVEIDHALPSGGKFETFAHTDRVLALDLCHLVGKLRR